MTDKALPAEKAADVVVPRAKFRLANGYITALSLIVVGTVQVANAIALEATLSFLGLGLPPTEPSLGMLIANALVGTFLGILLAYGFVGPLASLLEQKLVESSKMLECIKCTLLASLNGYSPALAVEFGRKVLYSTERPSFLELEAHVKRK